MKKIYISLKQVEQLVFDKMTIILESQLRLTRAQREFSIRVTTIDDSSYTDLKNDKMVILTSGAIVKFEIPKKEENLIVNHFRIPKGMYTTTERKAKDNNDILANDYLDERILFNHMRRGFIGCYILLLTKLTNDESTPILNIFNGIINNIRDISPFKKEFISTVIKYESFPIKERNDGKFYDISIKRFNWLGNYIMERLCNSQSESEQATMKKWLLCFKDKNDLKKIKEALSSTEDVYKPYRDFLFGYYIASSFYEEHRANVNYESDIIKFLNKLDIKDQKIEILLWSVFFHAFYKEELDFLYFIPSLQDQQYRIELKILEFVFTNIEGANLNLELKPIDKKDGIIEFVKRFHSDGRQNKSPELICEDKINSLFKCSINKKTKVYIEFFEFGKELKSFISNSNLYKECKKNKKITVNSIVIVLMTDEDSESIQSMDFQNIRIELTNRIERDFDCETYVLIKSKTSNSDAEIKRNLRHLIGKYKIEQMFVFNSANDPRIFRWILNSNNQYIVEGDYPQYRFHITY